MEIKCDVPFEVNLKQFNALKSKAKGIVMFREEKGKYFIKVMLMQYLPFVTLLIEGNEK